MATKRDDTVTLTAPVAYKLPSLPNFLVASDSLPGVDVADLSDDQIDQLGKAWTSALKAHASKRREAR